MRGPPPRRFVTALALLFFAVGCTTSTPAARTELREQKALAKLVPAAARPPLTNAQQTEDYFAILRLFAAKPDPEEVIHRFVFISPDAAEIGFSWSAGFHGGVARFEREDGRWIFVEKFWLM